MATVTKWRPARTNMYLSRRCGVPLYQYSQRCTGSLELKGACRSSCAFGGRFPSCPASCGDRPRSLLGCGKMRRVGMRPAVPPRRLDRAGARQELSCASLARTRSDSARTPGVLWSRSSVPRYRVPGCPGPLRAVDSHLQGIVLREPREPIACQLGQSIPDFRRHSCPAFLSRWVTSAER